MRQFAIGFFGIFILGFAAIWVWVSGHSAAMLNGELVQTFGKLEMARHCDTGTLVILGDSRPTIGIHPTRIGPGVVNLAIGASATVESYFIARKILSCPNHPKAVLVSFSGDYFYGGWDLKYPIMTFLPKHGINDFSDLEDIRKNSRKYGYDFLGKEEHGDIEIIMQDLGYAYRFPPYYFSEMIPALLSPDEEGKQRAVNEIYKKRGEWPTGGGESKGLSNETHYEHLTPLPFFEEYFDRLIILFASHHIPVYFLVMPVNQESMDAMKSSFISDFTAYLSGYVKKYPNFHLLNSTFTVLRSSEFVDPQHLNYEGALLWSDQVREMLNEAHVPGSPFIPGSSEIDNTIHH